MREFTLACTAMLVVVSGPTLVSPLYPLFQDRFGLNNGQVGLVAAMYAVTLIPALFVAGPLSDRWGRPALLGPGLALFVLGDLAFIFANSVHWLVAGRLVHGLAMGAFFGPTAALASDLVDKRRPDHAALGVGVASMVGFGIGPLVAGLLIHLDLNPRSSPSSYMCCWWCSAPSSCSSPRGPACRVQLLCAAQTASLGQGTERSRDRVERLSMRALEQLRMVVDGAAPAPPIARRLGFTLKAIAPGEGTVELVLDEGHTSQLRTVHGGVLCDIADAAMGMAYASTLQEGETFATLELKINFLRPVRRGRLLARARVVSAGRTVGLVECDITDDRSRLVARAASTCITLRGVQALNREGG
jgi:uncharacterized protein (TIGR00369 family)